MDKPSALTVDEVPAVAKTLTDAVLVEPYFAKTFHCLFVVVAFFGSRLRSAPFSIVEKAVVSRCVAPPACYLVTEFVPEFHLMSSHPVDHALRVLCVVFLLRLQPLALCGKK